VTLKRIGFFVFKLNTEHTLTLPLRSGPQQPPGDTAGFPCTDCGAPELPGCRTKRVAPTFDLEFALFITAGPSRYVCVLCGANSCLASMAARTQSTTLRHPSERERETTNRCLL
jgi:hypothetical protein